MRHKFWICGVKFVSMTKKSQDINSECLNMKSHWKLKEMFLLLFSKNSLGSHHTHANVESSLTLPSISEFLLQAWWSQSNKPIGSHIWLIHSHVRLQETGDPWGSIPADSHSTSNFHIPEMFLIMWKRIQLSGKAHLSNFFYWQVIRYWALIALMCFVWVSELNINVPSALQKPNKTLSTLFHQPASIFCLQLDTSHHPPTHLLYLTG